MADNALLIVERVLGTPASKIELDEAHIHLGSTCRAMAERAKKESWLGSTPEQQVQVQEWLLRANTQLSPLRDDALVQLNQYLGTRTFLVGTHAPTLADLVIFAVTLPATTTLPIAQHHQFANLLRWADTVQGSIGEHVVLQASLTPLRVQKPVFLPPPPVVPAPAAAKAAPAPASTSKPAAGTAAAPAAPAAAVQGGPQGSKGGKEAPAQGAPAADSKATGGKKDKGAEGGKKEKGAEGGKKEGAPAEKSEGGKVKKDSGKKEEEEARIDMLDIRVGKITQVGKHPNADSLYLEEIDVGEDKPRQVISGLVKFVPIEEMQGRRVVVVCNLKPAKMRDVMSYGMVLCASNDTHDKVVPICPPEGAKVGERITVAGYDQAPLEEVNPKKKLLERLFPDMQTDAGGVPCYKNVPFTTSAGPVTSPVPEAHVA